MANEDKSLNKEKRKYHVPAVEIAFRILKLLSRTKNSKSNLTEIATSLSLTPTTCYRILQQLQELAAVRYDSKSKRYSLGPYLLVLGERAKENLFDISLIIPYLETLAEKTGLTSALITRIGRDRSVVVAKAEGTGFSINVTVGKHFHVVDGVYGKCFLAYMDEEDVDELLTTDKGLRKFTEKEIIELKEELIEIRDKGYATTFGEYSKGMYGVASPIFNHDKRVEMAVCIFGLTAQANKEDMISLGEIVRGIGDEITTKLIGNE
ncbi:IclR family transcriptional regulator [Neobacillus niacini]|uniref:IclR family transcriptional regulator n=1 Tax=Neobacillus niacini TaxID=86668 RepID=UPI00203E6820|nr:IclR family transcriptional regulator [Neobacillus niacini]MCM3691075.1 IclR family transcriptional regulator [Neobacillus niacini]